MNLFFKSIKVYSTIVTSKLVNSIIRIKTLNKSILGNDRNPKQLFPEETLITSLANGL